jgi:hypothetical protein
MGDIEDARSAHTALLAASAQSTNHWGHCVQFNSTGTRVVYQSPDGIYELSTAGSATPTRWVASTSQGKPVGQCCEYLDDDTVLYTLYDYKKNVKDVCRKVRGASAATNLTGDVSASCMASAAR